MFLMIDHVPIVWAFDHPREAFQRARNAFVVGMGEGPGLGNTRIRIRYVILLQGLELGLDGAFRRQVGVRCQQLLTGCRQGQQTQGGKSKTQQIIHSYQF